MRKNGKNAKKVDPALQYAPYKSLKGFYDMIDDVDEKRRIEPRKIRSEDQTEILDWTVRTLKAGMMVHGTYYRNGHYKPFSGMVRAINLERRRLTLSDKAIDLDDIFELYQD